MDYRYLNSVTTAESYSLLQMEELGGNSVFKLNDFHSAFWPIPVTMGITSSVTCCLGYVHWTSDDQPRTVTFFK